MGGEPVDDLTVTLQAADRLSAAAERKAVEALFERSYHAADVEYLRDSMRHLRTIALAVHAGGLAGFALAESRRIDLPRLPGTVVRLAGLACVDPAFRRRHLMSELSGRAVSHELPDQPGLVCGRMAHPASFRGMTRLAGVVPTAGVAPTPWQQAVGGAVADAYGVQHFEPETFVCRGRGRPIGYPRIDIDATDEEWELFRPVDRARGDSLLGIAWLFEAPKGW